MSAAQVLGSPPPLAGEATPRVAPARPAAWRRGAPAVAAYLCCALGALAAAGWALRLHKADLDIPFAYRGDVVVMLTLAKGLIETDSVLTNPAIGAPWGREMHDYPLPEALNLATLELAGQITGNAARTVNLVYLASFPLAALTALFALRRLRVGRPLAVALAVLYSLMPYHFQRSEHHLLLSLYYLVPLSLVVAYWVSSPAAARSRWWALGRGRTLGALAICILLGGGGAYYAFFGAFFLLVAGVLGTVRWRRLANLATAVALVALVTGVLGLQLVPHYRYQRQHGNNPAVANHPAADAELYGLRLTELLLPVSGHRLKFLAQVPERYETVAPRVSERAGNLGAVGTAGFLLSLGWLVLGTGRERLLQRFLASLSGAGVLLGTVSGGGAQLALWGVTTIRAYNRVSIFLAFLALAAVGWSLQRWLIRLGGRPKRGAAGIAAAGLLAVGLFDQVSPRFAPDHFGTRAQWSADARFVEAVERRLPAGAMVFQLPYVPHPESPPQQRMADYDHFRPYLHSQGLRWSYGAMRGRYGDLWQADVTRRAMPGMLAALTKARYAAVLVDRFGYTDLAAEIEAQLAAELGPPAEVSDDSRLALFLLADGQTPSGDTPSPGALLARWGEGFSGLEQGPEGEWRWCSGEGELELVNGYRRPLQARLTMQVATGHQQPSRLRVRGADIADDRWVAAPGTPVGLTLQVPADGLRLRISSDAPRVEAPGDPRTLVFRVLNFRLGWQEPAPPPARERR